MLIYIDILHRQIPIRILYLNKKYKHRQEIQIFRKNTSFSIISTKSKTLPKSIEILHQKMYDELIRDKFISSKRLNMCPYSLPRISMASTMIIKFILFVFIHIKISITIESCEKSYILNCFRGRETKFFKEIQASRVCCADYTMQAKRYRVIELSCILIRAPSYRHTMYLFVGLYSMRLI